MYLNLFMIFSSVWFFIGFIEYGLIIGNMHKEKDYNIDDNCFKIFLMFFCLFFGIVIIYFTLKNEDFLELRFW